MPMLMPFCMLELTLLCPMELMPMELILMLPTTDMLPTPMLPTPTLDTPTDTLCLESKFNSISSATKNVKYQLKRLLSLDLVFG